MNKPMPYRIAITAGGVKKNGELTWLTRRRVKAMTENGKGLEELGIPFYYACVPTSPANDAHSVLRRAVMALHPQYDGEVLTPPEGLQIRSQKARNRFLHQVALARGEISTIIHAF